MSSVWSSGWLWISLVLIGLAVLQTLLYFCRINLLGELWKATVWIFAMCGGSCASICNFSDDKKKKQDEQKQKFLEQGIPEADLAQDENGDWYVKTQDRPASSNEVDRLLDIVGDLTQILRRERKGDLPLLPGNVPKPATPDAPSRLDDPIYRL
jgi:hypothetical protein